MNICMVRVYGTFFSFIEISFFIENSFFLFFSSSHSRSLAMLLARSMTESVVLLVGTVVVIGTVVQPSGGVWTNALKKCHAEFVWSR